jgi:surface antigen
MAKETGAYPRWGNANNFPANARASGYGTGSEPRAGSLGVISAGYFGHVVYVEAVDGNRVLVAQYNYNWGAGWGLFSRMWVAASTYDTYIYL